VIGIRVDRDGVTKDVATAMGLPSVSGAMLSSVTAGGPAEKAGLQPGDIITEYNGRPVADSEALVNMVVATKPGTSVPVTVYRKKTEADPEHHRRRARSRRRAGTPGERREPWSRRRADRHRLRHGGRPGLRPRSPVSSNCRAIVAARS
jgi:serine protease Do